MNFDPAIPVPNTNGALFAGYMAIWIIIIAYVWMLQRRVCKLEQAKSLDENCNNVG